MRITNPNKKPLLLHIVPTAKTLLAFFAGQIEYMKKNGFEVAATSSPRPKIELVEQRDHIKVYQIPMSRGFSPLTDIITLLALFKTMKRLHPTIVHGHTAKGELFGMIAAYLARVPVRVISLHGPGGYSGKNWIKKKIVQGCVRLSCRLAQRIFSVSESVYQKALNLRYCGEDKIKVLANGSYNGIDAKSRFNPEKYPKETKLQIRQRYGIPHDALVLGYAGRIVPDKGITELVEAWQKLRVEFENLYLLLVGELESEYPMRQQAIQILNEDPRITITGFVDNMPEHYLAMDLLTLPTYREGFPYSILEAAAMGLSVVATNVVGCVDAVEDNRTGILVPAKDPGALYETIKKLLLDRSLRTKLGQAGRQRVLERFAPEPIWKALHLEYTALMKKYGVRY